MGREKSKCSVLSVKRCGHQNVKTHLFDRPEAVLSAKVSATDARKTSSRFLPV